MRRGALGLLAVLLTLLMGAVNGLGRVDIAIQDPLRHALKRPASTDIVMVVIDNRSLGQIGRWPWRRAIHAALLDRLTVGNARAVGIDLILTEPDATSSDLRDDELFAAALRRSGVTVLPVIADEGGDAGPDGVLRPVQVLADAVRALGHIRLAPDNDGVVRRHWQADGALTGWPSMPQALAAVGRGEPARAGWSTSLPSRELIGYVGGPGSFAAYSYVDVLKGEVASSVFADKYVLIGVFAQGMGDAYAVATPEGVQTMAGVEILANVLDAQLSGRRLMAAPAWGNALFNVVPVVLALLAILTLSPAGILLALSALAVASLLVAYLAVGQLGQMFAPATALLTMAAIYVVWSWRSIVQAIRIVFAEARGLGLDARRAMFDPDSEVAVAPRRASLGEGMAELQLASQQLRSAQRFTQDVIASLPAAAVVTDAGARVILCNRASVDYFGVPDEGFLVGRSAQQLMADLRSRQTGVPIAAQMFERCADVGAAIAFEVSDAAGRDLLVKVGHYGSEPGAKSGWLITWVDVSDLLQAQRQREDALRFLSHDIRSPQVSILALLARYRRSVAENRPDLLLLEKIERQAHRTLALAEDFVQLARAQSGAVACAPCDLRHLMEEAADDGWPQAHGRGVEIRVQAEDEAAWANVDAGLVARALFNLVDNAVKFSPERGIVECRIARTADAGWELNVADQGRGIAPELQALLFHRFSRLAESQGGPHIEGVGLGLEFVRAVAERHGGRAGVRSATGAGATFWLWFPAIEEPQNASPLLPAAE